MAVFLHSLEEGNSGILSAIEQEARAECVPMIRGETQSLLRLLLAMKRPRKILEVGTAVGFSAIFMATHDPVPCQVTTIENDGRMAASARRNFERAGMEGCIQLLEGDAMELLPGLSGSYDFIFMDAAKGQYIRFLPEILRLLAFGGTLVSDNVLQGGDILESRFAVARRDRTIHKRMREYLYALTHHPVLTTAVLPISDGVAVSERKTRGERNKRGKVRKQTEGVKKEKIRERGEGAKKEKIRERGEGAEKEKIREQGEGAGEERVGDE